MKLKSLLSIQTIPPILVNSILKSKIHMVSTPNNLKFKWNLMKPTITINIKNTVNTVLEVIIKDIKINILNRKIMIKIKNIIRT